MTCLLCQRPLTTKLTLPWLLSWQPVAQPVVCTACWQQFQPIILATACPQCGRAQPHWQVCRDCQRWAAQPDFQNVALFTYNEAMQAYFQHYKFQGDYRLRAVFQTIVQQRLQQLTADQVVTIPVTTATMATRGFNQVTGWLDTGINDGVLTVAKTVAQSQKDRQARLATKQPFGLAPGVDLSGQRIVLVDDVYTTGRTMRHAANLMLENGANSVTGLTLAR
ncbi:ComF family protein [Lactiplantibacillus songbeiensis]|uniref:ComF family protein n=1 Tax=Lactiplantibacillus songbeiensis TaxID=2559920 RepID=A0ABW4BY56_9LACO|nr:ComF family protein [Lactiplantibacillus songbeiensis]